MSNIAYLTLDHFANPREGHEPAGVHLKLYLGEPGSSSAGKNGVEGILTRYKLCDENAEKDDEWRDLYVKIKDICETIGRAVVTIYNVPGDVVNRGPCHAHEGEKYRKRLKNCMDRAKKGTGTILAQLPPGIGDVIGPLIERDLELLKKDYDYNLDMIMRDLEDPVDGRSTRARKSFVPNPEGAAAANPLAFIPDGAPEVSNLINSVVPGAATRNYQAEGAVPRAPLEAAAGPLLQTDETSGRANDECQEFNPLASCPDPEALDIGPHLRSYVVKELQSFFPGDEENIPEKRIFEWIVSSIFRPMKQLVTQEKLNLMDQEKKEIHEAQVRLNSIMMDSAQTLEEARQAQEVSALAKVPRVLTTWIQANIEPFISGEPLPTEGIILASVIKDVIRKVLGMQISFLDSEILEKLGREENIRAMNKRIQERGIADLRRNDERPRQGNRGGLTGGVPSAQATSNRPNNENVPSNDSGNLVNSMNASISAMDRGLETSMSSLRAMGLGRSRPQAPRPTSSSVRTGNLGGIPPVNEGRASTPIHPGPETESAGTVPNDHLGNAPENDGEDEFDDENGFATHPGTGSGPGVQRSTDTRGRTNAGPEVNSNRIGSYRAARVTQEKSQGRRAGSSLHGQNTCNRVRGKLTLIENKIADMKNHIAALTPYEHASAQAKRELGNRLFATITKEMNEYLGLCDKLNEVLDGLQVEIPGDLEDEIVSVESRGGNIYQELRSLFNECNKSRFSSEVNYVQPTQADINRVRYLPFSGGYGPEDLSFYEFKEDQESKNNFTGSSMMEAKVLTVLEALTGVAKTMVPFNVKEYDKVMEILKKHFGNVPQNMSLYKQEHKNIGEVPEVWFNDRMTEGDRNAKKKGASDVAYKHLLLVNRVNHMLAANPEFVYLKLQQDYLDVLTNILPSSRQLDISARVQSDPKLAWEEIKEILVRIHDRGAKVTITTAQAKEHTEPRRDFRPRTGKPPDNRPKPRIVAALTEVPTSGAGPQHHPARVDNGDKARPTPAPRNQSYMNVEYGAEDNYDCLFCPIFQNLGLGDNYFKNHPYTLKNGVKKFIFSQCPNYTKVGAVERRKAIVAARACPQCLRLVGSDHKCLSSVLAERHLCQFEGCNGERVENCILHRNANESRLESKKKGLSRSGISFVMAMLPASPLEWKEKGTSQQNELETVAFLEDPQTEPGETHHQDKDSASKKDLCFYPKNKPRLRTSQLIGERLDPGKMKLNFLLFGVIKGRKNGAVVLYDTGANSCLFESGVLENELEAAPLIGAKKISLYAAHGEKIFADPWEVSFPLKNPELENKIEKVCGISKWKLPVWDLSEERDMAFRDNYEEFQERASRDIANISIASDFGDCLHGIIGTNVKHLFPKEIATLDCGLTLFSTTLLPHSDAFEYLIGGPVEVFCANLNTKVLNNSCIKSSFVLAQQCGGTLNPERLLACIAAEVSDDDIEPGHVTEIETGDNCETATIEPYNSKIEDGLISVDLENVVQPHQVSMEDCMNGDAPRHRKSNIAENPEFECEDELNGKSVDDKISEIKSAWRASGSRELNLDINYTMDMVVIKARCPEHADCAPCLKEDPFESMSLATFKENQILAKCLHFCPDSFDYFHNLPFKEDPYKTLLNNRNKAELTLERTMKRLEKASPGDRESVSKSFMTLVQLGHIKEFDSLTKEQQIKLDKKPINWYIPWNLAWKEESRSTPVRIVFNASQKCGKFSLNDILYKGDMKTKLRLLSALYNFASNRVAIATDVSKFYNCLKLIEDNWNFQNVLWCPEMKVGGRVVRYLICTAIYGISSASVLTEMVFNDLASKHKRDKLIYWILMYGRYVDDIFASVKDLKTAIEAKKRITELLAKHKIRCKGWAISGLDPDESISEEGIIGVGGYPYHVKEDVIKIKVPLLDFSGTKARGQLLGSVHFNGSSLKELDDFVPKNLTLRQALSKTSSIFDPRGLISPYTLLTKLAFQDSIQSLGGFGNEVLDKTTKKLNKRVVLTAAMWDIPLPKKQRSEWVKLFFMAEKIRTFKFPRFPIPAGINTDECYLFGYGDAAIPGSQECIHIAFSNDGNCFHSVSLMNKNQVHSQKQAVKIPYKEMSAMTITAALLQKCKLALPNVKGVRLFSDSEISLNWVRDNGPDINNFIRGRCQIVRNYVEMDSLYHIKGTANISDTGTRRIADVNEISPTSSFYLGPECMKDFQKSVDEGIITPLANLKKISTNNPNHADAHLDKSELMEDHIVMAPLISGSAPRKLGPTVAYPTSKEECEAMINYVEECLDDIKTEEIVNAYCRATGKLPVKPKQKLFNRKRDFPFKLRFTGLGELNKIVEPLTNCWFKLCRIMGRVLRACYIFGKCSNVAFADCVQEAETLFLKNAMPKTEQMLKERPIKNFLQTIDENGLIRFQTRITQSKQDAPSLIVLSPHLPIAKKILYSFHCLTHSGVHATVSKSRLFYWIPQATKIVRKIKNSCTKCRLLDAEALTQLMAPIPPFRRQPAPPWYHTMVDLFGPISVRDFVKRRIAKKTWAVIFACLYTRAIWVYLAESYSTDSFLNVIKKHEARNGSAAVYYADLGSQIKGAERTMQEAAESIDRSAIEEFSARNNTIFKFGIPLHSAGQGPVERLIKEVKRCLGIISRGISTFGETETMLFEASYMVNSRPLLYHPHGGEDSFICPNDILFGRSSKNPPLLKFINCNLAKRITLQQEIMNDFWGKWSSSYLQSLHSYQKWRLKGRNLKIGDLVLVLDKKVFPGKFLTGEILNIFPASDGNVRRVVVKYKLHSRDGDKFEIKTKTFKQFERSPHGLALLLAEEERKEIGVPIEDLDGVIADDSIITMPDVQPTDGLKREQEVYHNGKLIKLKQCEVRLERQLPASGNAVNKSALSSVTPCEVKLKRLPKNIIELAGMK